MTHDGLRSQVLDSGKDLKVLLEETAPVGAARESLKSHLKQGVHPEKWTLQESPSSHQRPGEQSGGKQKPPPSPEAEEEQSSMGNTSLSLTD